MFWQLHWQSINNAAKTEVKTQFEIPNEMCPLKALKKVKEEVNYAYEKFPVPKGFQWALINENSMRFKFGVAEVVEVIE